MNNLDLISFLQKNYCSCEFCTLLYEDKCRYSLEIPNIEKCDKCFLFHSKLATRYQKILRRYKK